MTHALEQVKILPNQLFWGHGLADQKIHNFQNCPRPHQKLRPREVEGQQRNSLWKPSRKSIAISDVPDDLFTFSESQVPWDSEEIWAGRVFWPNTGKCAISKQKSAKKACFCYSEALIGPRN